jgi:hypothetical protein
MAYAARPVEPKAPPAVVTLACRLLYVAAAASLLSLILTLSQLGASKRAYREAFAGTSMESAAQVSAVAEAVFAVFLGLLFGIGFVVLAILIGRGRNPARILTWVAAGLAVCVSGCGLVLDAVGAGGFVADGGAEGAPTSQEIQQALNDAWPGWYQPALITIDVISLAALLAAVVLLALPAANAFFRRTPEPGWVPPVTPVPPPTA